MHKQIKQLSLLLSEKFRQSLESKAGQSQHAKTNAKVDMLHNALLIAKWIAEFDSQNINDCFDDRMEAVPVNV